MPQKASASTDGTLHRIVVQSADWENEIAVDSLGFGFSFFHLPCHKLHGGERLRAMENLPIEGAVPSISHPQVGSRSNP